MDTDKFNFGSYIKVLRKEKKLSLRQVEIKTGISNSYISLIERGKREIPTPDIIKKLAMAYNASYEDLMLKAGYIENIVSVKDSTDTVYDLKKEYVEFAKDLQKHNISIERAKKILEFLQDMEK